MTNRPARVHRIVPVDPGGEPVCLLTAEGARAREVPIDRLLDEGSFQSTEMGYEIRLPAGERYWTLAREFVDEEAACCSSLQLEVEERDQAVIVRASF